MGDSQHTATNTRSAGHDVIVIALGILVAAVVVVIVMQLSRPSSIDCATQRVEVSNGTRDAVDPDCAGR